MMIHVGADHGGFALKEALKSWLLEKGYSVDDAGNTVLDAEDDFPSFAGAVARAVGADPAQNRGIVLCRSGVGVDVVANKFPGVRSALAISPDHVFQSRHDDDANILAIAADFFEEETAKKMVAVFLETPFDASEKRMRRLRQIEEIERMLKTGRII